MVLYDVYCAKFFTEKETYREYVGYSGDVCRRKDKLKNKGVDWTKPMKKGTLHMDNLAVDIQTRAVARCQEALSAARKILADRDHVRGGPWLSVKPLSQNDMMEIAAVASCKSLVDLGPLAEELGPDSRLAQHLKNIEFPRKTNLAASSSAAAPTISSSSFPKQEPEQVQIQTYATSKQISIAGVRGARPKQAKASTPVKMTAAAKSNARTQERLATYIRTKRSGTSTWMLGHTDRVANNFVPGTPAFDAHKYGKKGPRAARRQHWINYAPRRPARVLKKPAMLKKPATLKKSPSQAP